MTHSGGFGPNGDLNKLLRFETHVKDIYLQFLPWNCPEVNATRHDWSSVNTDADNGLVSSGNKPLSGPILTKIPIAIWRNY